MAKNQPRKPTGEIRSRALEVGHGPAALAPIQSFKLPEVKNDAEDVVMQKFVELSQRHDNAVLPVLRSAFHFPTDHGPDFEVVTASGATEFFELFELAPLKGKYEDADHSMLVDDIVDFLIQQIQTKIRKYTEPQFRPISLLIYASHYGFSPGELETKCLLDALQSVKNDVFVGIYLELFSYDGSPFAVRLFPHKGRFFTKSELVGHRRRQMVRADPNQIKIMEDRSEGNRIDVTVRQYLPPGTDLSKIKVGSTSNLIAPGIGAYIKVRPSNR